MAQTIWIHKLADTQKTQAEGMEYICEHLFQGLTQAGKLTKDQGLESGAERQLERWQHVPGAILRFVRKELQQRQRADGKRTRTGVRGRFLWQG